jgi:ketosteroid isomerase-like protein
MSQENVETVRLVYERFNNGDIDGALQLCTTDYEFRDLPALPGSGVHIGHDANRAWAVQMRETFEDLRFEPDEIIDAGGDRVVVECRVVGRGKVSGAELDMFTLLTYNVFTLSNGALVSCITYDERAEALEAAGLREGSVSQHNVEAAAYEAYAAFARQDWAAFMTHFHDDAEVREEPGSVPDPAVYRGRAEIERYYRDYHRLFENPSAEVVEVRPAGDKTVLSLRFRGRARKSGVEVDGTFAQVGTWREGRLTLVQQFRTPEEGLEAVGLRDESLSQADIEAAREKNEEARRILEAELRMTDAYRRRTF